LDRREVEKEGETVQQIILVQWQSGGREGATWEEEQSKKTNSHISTLRTRLFPIGGVLLGPMIRNRRKPRRCILGGGLKVKAETKLLR